MDFYIYIFMAMKHGTKTWNIYSFFSESALKHQGGTDEDVELPEMDDWDQWDEDEDPKSWEERVTYF